MTRAARRRWTEQWAASRPADATHIPAEEIDIRLAELPPDVRIVILSRTSQESERVVRFLRHRGLDDTWSLHGGLEAWKKAHGYRWADEKPEFIEVFMVQVSTSSLYSS